MYIVGIDVGTSGAKAAIFDLEGSMVAKARRGYSAIFPADGWMELDPEIVWQKVRECLKELAENTDVSCVKALAVSTQGEAMVPVDPSGNPLMNAILTFDSRNAGEYRWFTAHTDRKTVMKLTGMPAHPMFSATKLLWLRKKKPEIFADAWKFMCFGDFIAYRLGAAPVMDYSMASRTMLFDLQERKWSGKLLDLCGVPLEKLPELAPAGELVGQAGPALTELGYPAGLQIFCGSHDQVCCALGAGVFEDGVAMDSLGTTESTVCVSRELRVTEEMLEYSIPVYPYPGGTLYAYMTFLTSCASLLEWFREKVVHLPDDSFYREYDTYIAAHCPGPMPVFVLPYFAGAGTPSMDFRAKGLIWGLTLDTDRYQIYKAILEGTCFEQRRNLSNMERGGIGVRELRCIGGGARSGVWLQMKADITGKRVVAMECEEAGCLGAAMLAGVGCKAFRDVEEAGGRFARKKCQYNPDPEMAARYTDSYKAYLRLDPSVLEMRQGG